MWAIGAALTLAVLFAPLPLPAPAPTERFFRVEASSFAFSPAELRVNPGDQVTVELVATDVVHGFAIYGYPVQFSADPGQPARFSFIADRNGSFRIRCITPCGNMHPFMLGKFRVGPNLLLYRASLLAIIAAISAVSFLKR